MTFDCPSIATEIARQGSLPAEAVVVRMIADHTMHITFPKGPVMFSTTPIELAFPDNLGAANGRCVAKALEMKRDCAK